MHLTIYFNDKPLFLCDDIDTPELREYLHHDDTMFMDELSSPAIKSMIYEMQLAKIHAGVYYHPVLDELKKAFWKKFKVIQAGGGLVENERGERLLIFRRGKWDLPKGKVDKGETLEAASLREVQEETGLKRVNIVKPLPCTYHTYMQDAKLVLKENYWYLMRAESAEMLVPQTEEDIERIIWADAEQVAECLKNTYSSVKQVLSY
jgi:8-oxo-dGTP pyrophosphatase MutT (NUDIX family)